MQSKTTIANVIIGGGVFLMFAGMFDFFGLHG